MVFLIQITQTRDALAMQLTLDELIRATETADNAVINAEDETDEALAPLKRYIFFGEGDIVPTTREILRKAEPDPAQRPVIHVG